jgi:hypothetical protein
LSQSVATSYDIIVNIDGAMQVYNFSYTTTGSTINFSEFVPSGSVVDIRFLSNPTTVSSSFASKAASSDYATTASYVIGGGGGGGGTTLVSKSLYDISSSYALTASYALNGGGGGTSLVSGSTYNITSSNAVTASYASNVTLPNNLISASAQLSNNGGVAFTSTNNITVGQITASNAQITNLTVQYVTSSVLVITGSNKFGDASDDVQQFTGSVEVSGSFKITGSLNANLTGTSSYATTSSYAITASYAASGGTLDILPTTNNTYLVYQDGVLKWVPIVSALVVFAANTYTMSEYSVSDVLSVATVFGFVSVGYTSGSI